MRSQILDLDLVEFRSTRNAL